MKALRSVGVSRSTSTVHALNEPGQLTPQIGFTARESFHNALHFVAGAASLRVPCAVTVTVTVTVVRAGTRP